MLTIHKYKTFNKAIIHYIFTTYKEYNLSRSNLLQENDLLQGVINTFISTLSSLTFIFYKLSYTTLNQLIHSKNLPSHPYTFLHQKEPFSIVFSTLPIRLYPLSYLVLFYFLRRIVKLSATPFRNILHRVFSSLSIYEVVYLTLILFLE